MIHILKRTGAAILAFLLAAAVSTPEVTQEAAALQYTGTDSYMSGKYYHALRQVCLTGDSRADMVRIARSQLGYQEGGSPNQLSGQVYGGVNHTEYGAWYGLQDMWCAMFVSWCAKVAGVSEDIIPCHAFTPNGLQWFADRGQAYSREEVEAGIYTPRAGDLVYFKSSRNTRATNHVGLVTGYGNGQLYTIEGNVASAGVPSNGGAVVDKSYPISNTFIVFICSPDYELTGTNVQPSDQKDQRLYLRYALASLETGGEVGYNAVSAAPSLSLGIGQWSGQEAVALLEQIRQTDRAGFALLDTAGIGERLDRKQLPLAEDPNVITCLKLLLSSHAGVQVQENKMDTDIRNAMKLAKTLGVQDKQTQLLCAAVAHLGGTGMVRRCVERAQENLSQASLLTALEQIDPQLHRSCKNLIHMEGNYVELESHYLACSDCGTAGRCHLASCCSAS